jgi:hypothetical protein
MILMVMTPNHVRTWYAQFKPETESRWVIDLVSDIRMVDVSSLIDIVNDMLLSDKHKGIRP